MSYLKVIGYAGLAVIASTLAIFPDKNNQKYLAIALDNNVKNADNVTVEEVKKNHLKLINEQVTLRGEVEQLDPNFAFKIEDNGLFGGEEILVLNRSGRTIPKLPQGKDTRLQVTGEVGEFIWIDAARKYNLDLPREEFIKYNNQPVIYADWLVLSPTPTDISRDPLDYYYKTIAVEAEVKDIKGYKVFTLEEQTVFGGEDLLVIIPNSVATPEENKKVVVTGLLRPFVMSEFERHYDLTWDLDLKKKIEVEYYNRPVLVANDIYTSAE